MWGWTGKVWETEGRAMPNRTMRHYIWTWCVQGNGSGFRKVKQGIKGWMEKSTGAGSPVLRESVSKGLGKRWELNKEKRPERRAGYRGWGDIQELKSTGPSDQLAHTYLPLVPCPLPPTSFTCVSRVQLHCGCLLICLSLITGQVPLLNWTFFLSHQN